MRIADTLSIGISNAHGGNEIILVATPDRGSFIKYISSRLLLITQPIVDDAFVAFQILALLLFANSYSWLQLLQKLRTTNRQAIFCQYFGLDSDVNTR